MVLSMETKQWKYQINAQTALSNVNNRNIIYTYAGLRYYMIQMLPNSSDNII